MRKLDIETVKNWNDLNDIQKSFLNLGFIKIKKFTESFKKEIDEKYTSLKIQIDEDIFLKILIVDPKTTTYNKYFDSHIRYLLIIKNFETFEFIKQIYDPINHHKESIYKFKKSTLNNKIINRLNDSLVPNSINCFNNLFTKKDIIDKFYKEYKNQLDALTENINGIVNKNDKFDEAKTIFNRLIFCYFIQKKLLLNNDNEYLKTHFKKIEDQIENNNYYEDFLKLLFFEVLNKEKNNRKNINYDFGDIPFMNGGLFRENNIEINNPNIKISNIILGDILEFLSSWVWYVDENAEIEDRGINPEILGYIFERTIGNQKSKGAFYTPIDVTEFIFNSTVIKYCIEQINIKFNKNYNEFDEILKNKQHSVYLFADILWNIKILDPACGSGAFLLTILNLLFKLYVRIWSEIKNCKSEKILKLNLKKYENYKFKKHIITSNVFGVDLETDATEICKLRLWLSLVINSTNENIEPLPNIDYNVLTGNSLLGYYDKSKFQTSLDNSDVPNEILKQIQILKDEFNAELDQKKSLKIRNKINKMLEPYNQKLNDLKQKEFNFGLKNDEYSSSDVDKFNPFHWILQFNSILENDGFDIIIGNPPYVVKSKINYPTKQFQTDNCRNTFVYFYELSFKLLKNKGWIGFILPVSSISTDNMIPLHDLLFENSSELFISNFSDASGKIFENLPHCRSSIILSHKKNSSIKSYKVFTTDYIQWKKIDRDDLFSNIEYIDSTNMLIDGSIPKFGNQIEINILKKIMKKPKLKSYLSSNTINNTSNSIIFHNAPDLWIHATDYIPKFRISNKPRITMSSHNKILYTQTKQIKNIVLPLLNSSLFFWYFQKVSDCRDLGQREIKNFGLDVESFSKHDINILIKHTNELMDNFKKHAKPLLRISKKDSHITGYDKFSPKHGKQIINKIDDVLAKHYDLTAKELDYIKNYKINFRMGTLI